MHKFSWNCNCIERHVDDGATKGKTNKFYNNFRNANISWLLITERDGAPRKGKINCIKWRGSSIHLGSYNCSTADVLPGTRIKQTVLVIIWYAHDIVKHACVANNSQLPSKLNCGNSQPTVNCIELVTFIHPPLRRSSSKFNPHVTGTSLKETEKRLHFSNDHGWRKLYVILCGAMTKFRIATLSLRITDSENQLILSHS